MKLIGFDATDGGAVVRQQTSINFLTKKKLVRVNTNENAESGEEVFKETWTPVRVTNLPRLSEINDFDALDMSSF